MSLACKLRYDRNALGLKTGGSRRRRSVLRTSRAVSRSYRPAYLRDRSTASAVLVGASRFPWNTGSFLEFGGVRPKPAGQLERSSDGSSGWSRIGSKGVRSVLRATPPVSDEPDTITMATEVWQPVGRLCPCDADTYLDQGAGVGLLRHQ